MAQKEPERFRLRAPDGTEVTVVGESRRDVLTARGYHEGGAKARPSATGSAAGSTAEGGEAGGAERTSGATRAQASREQSGERRTRR